MMIYRRDSRLQLYSYLSLRAMRGLSVLLVCLAIQSGVMGRSSGPPAGEPAQQDLVCNQLTPNPLNHGNPTPGNGGYLLAISPLMTETATGYTYVPNQIYTIQLLSTTTNTFRGFLVQARLPTSMPAAGVNAMLLGSFNVGAANQQTLDCDIAAGAATTASIGHSSNLGGVSSVQFTWTAPSMPGDVNFFYTVVQTRLAHFDAISARAVGIVMPPARAPENYRLILTHPQGCDRSQCTVYVGIDTNAGNSGYLDIYMEHEGAGYMAVGFSETFSMFNSDVVACNRVASGETAARDTYNVASPGRDSPTDTIENVFLFQSSFIGGRLSCTILKQIAPAGNGEDLDLNATLNIIWGRHTNSSPSIDALIGHSDFGIFTASGAPINPVTITSGLGNTLPSPRAPENYRLILTHPQRCDRSQCTVYVGIDTNTGNSGYLDIYMEHEGAGYVAVGFSNTSDMFNSDVVACNRNGNGEIAARDTYNVASPGRNSTTDTIENVFLFQSSFIGGRLSCMIVKQIAPEGNGEDLDLNAALNIIWGRYATNPSPSIDTIIGHSDRGFFTMPGDPINPVTGRSVPGNTLPPTRAPENYRLILTHPSGCSRTQCIIYIGIDTNTGDNGYLDIYMEHEGAGYVAIGFSETFSMFDSDVVACNRVASGETAARDTYNVAPTSRASPTDTIENVFLFQSSFTGGRLNCTIVKQIAPVGLGVDLDLNATLNIIWGRHVNPSPSIDALIGHSNFGIFTASGAPINPVTATNGPGNTLPPTRVPENYRLILTHPEGCNRSQCTVYVGIDTNAGNSGYLDIYMEHEGAGYVAVGFSETRDMFNSDVVACNRNESGYIAARDTYNVASPERDSPTDTIENVFLFQSSFTGGRLSCTILKQIAPGGNGEDLDLNADLHIIWGRHTNSSPSIDALIGHSDFGIFTASGAPINPTGNLPPGSTIAPQRTPDEYGITLTLPSTGCNRVDCDLFIGIAVNSGDPGFIDIYMEGTAEGWLAVGFSASMDMFSADVVSCNRVGDTIEALDGWNPPSPRRSSMTDSGGVDDVTLYSSDFDASSRRMYCTVSKRVAPSSSEDMNLTQPLFLIYARRVPPSSQLNSLESHSTGDANNRGVTSEPLIAASGMGIVVVDPFDEVHRPNLIRAHGILMFIAWPVLAVTAILFAIFMRPALPNGEWFQVHRALMIASLIITVIAFILAFVALRGPALSPSQSVAHMIIGIIIVALQLVNPILAIFRCNPNSENRWIFNLFHGYLIGYIAENLSFINVGLGLSAFTSIFSLTFSIGNQNQAPLWLFVAWAVLQFFIVVGGYIAFSIYAYIKKDSACAPSAVKPFVSSGNEKVEKPSQAIEMNPASGEKAEPVEEKKERKPPSKDAPLRWAVIGVYLTILLPITLAIIIMIAVP